MASLTLDQVRPGMVLAADVFDRRGRLLMRPGNELTERHIDALRMWGVMFLEVSLNDDEPEVVEEMDPAELAALEADLDDLFKNAGGPHPFLDRLREVAHARARKRGSGVPVSRGAS